MISPAVFDVVRCPDCTGRVVAGGESARCETCRRTFDMSAGYLDLRPSANFDEHTKYLDAALHTDARHETIAPPLLGSKIRHDQLRRFLALGPGDRAVDLGCGSGRALAWNRETGATTIGIDISPFFAREALADHDLVLGDLRRMPVRDGAFTKAWTLDVLEHLSPEALVEVLAEANRILEPGGRLFAYSHVRRNGWPAVGVRLVNGLAHGLERVGLLSLRQERLRKSDHLNPLADHDDLTRVAETSGFRIVRITYYTPVIGAFVENVLVRMAERLLTGRARRRIGGAGAGDEALAARAVRTAAKTRVQRGGPVAAGLRMLSTIMALDIWLFGRIRSGPFFALLEKVGPAR
jgi:SAM-dependent methyltransferase